MTKCKKYENKLKDACNKKMVTCIFFMRTTCFFGSLETFFFQNLLQ